MILHRLLAAVGTAVVTFGLVAVAIIESLGAGEAPGIGILGVGGGAFAALAALLLVALLFEELSGPVRAVIEGIAAVGWTAVVIGAGIYVNLLSIETTTVLAVAFVVGVLVAVYEWPRNRRMPDRDGANSN